MKYLVLHSTFFISMSLRCAAFSFPTMVSLLCTVQLALWQCSSEVAQRAGDQTRHSAIMILVLLLLTNDAKIFVI